MSVYEILYIAVDGIDYPTGKYFSTLQYAIDNCIENGYSEHTSISEFWTNPCACLENPKNGEMNVIIERKIIK